MRIIKNDIDATPLLEDGQDDANEQNLAETAVAKCGPALGLYLLGRDLLEAGDSLVRLRSLSKWFGPFPIYAGRGANGDSQV